GGTRFIGRAILDRLLAAGHRVTLLHRGKHPLTVSNPEIEVVSWDRKLFPRVPEVLRGRRIEAVVDTCAGARGDVAHLLAGLRPLRYVLPSSVDVYRAFGTILASGPALDPVPIAEDAPLRSERYVFRELLPDRRDYEKLDCEAEALANQDVEAVILRLPF